MPSGQSGTREDFEAAAQAIWDGLPEQFRAVLSNVTVHVADFADAETLKAMAHRRRAGRIPPLAGGVGPRLAANDHHRFQKSRGILR